MAHGMVPEGPDMGVDCEHGMQQPVSTTDVQGDSWQTDRGYGGGSQQAQAGAAGRLLGSWQAVVGIGQQRRLHSIARSSNSNRAGCDWRQAGGAGLTAAAITPAQAPAHALLPSQLPSPRPAGCPHPCR